MLVLKGFLSLVCLIFLLLKDGRWNSAVVDFIEVVAQKRISPL